MAHVSFQLNFGKTYIRSFSKLNTLLNSVNTLETFAKAVIRSHNKTFFNNVSKILAEVRKVFNFEKFLIYVLPKFN